MEELARDAEAFLFVEGGSLSRKKLSSLLGKKESELNDILSALATSLKGRGISLIVADTEVSLAVSPDSAATIKKALELELSRDIGDAGLEVLAIVLYRRASTRAHIDYIRGVNTSSTLRNLLARGLIERAGNPDDAREYLYRPTVDLLAHLGITSVKDLPEHATIAGELASFEATNEGPFQPNDATESK